MSPRETALCVFVACRRSGAWSNAVLKEYIARDHLDARDAALCSRICYGVEQNRGKLDFYLNQLLRKKGKLHPAVRDILHMGLYQLFEMDRIPDSAAVNESVTLAQKYCKNQPGAAGLVNGVLRSALRERDNLKQPVSYADRYSHPDELISLLKANLPKGTLEEMLIADNQAPQTVIQVNRLKTDRDTLTAMLEQQGVPSHPHPWMTDCLILERTGNLEKLPAFRDGLFYVQDAASKLSVLCAQLPKTGAKVLDCCAAPGGKSFAAVMAMQGTGSVISCDVYPHKAELIAGGAKRLGITNLEAKVQDASAFVPAWKEQMDCVIVDAPCSGLGIIRKKPDIRYKDLTPMAQLPQLQLSILKNQANYVRPGGTLMYSTCTVLHRENREVVKAFLGSRDDFVLTPLSLPEGIREDETGMLTLIPGQYDTDGFFICRMERKS